MTNAGTADRRAAGRGFTLVETLLVLAVIALLSALLLPGVNSILRSIDQAGPDRIAWDAIAAARAQALAANHSVWLSADEPSRSLRWGEGEEKRRFGLPAGTSVHFLEPVEGNRILIGGVMLETRELPAVRFYPDGTCDRFRLQIRQGTGAPLVIPVDPWTCAPLLPPGGK